MLQGCRRGPVGVALWACKICSHQPNLFNNDTNISVAYSKLDVFRVVGMALWVWPCGRSDRRVCRICLHQPNLYDHF